MKCWLGFSFIVLMLLTGAPSSASAQVLYGSLVGNVTDETGGGRARRHGDDHAQRDRRVARSHYRQRPAPTVSPPCSRALTR